MSPSQTDFTAMRDKAKAIFMQGIRAADPAQAVANCLSVKQQQLEIVLDNKDSSQKRSAKWQKVHIVAFGKAACPMAKAAIEIIPEQLRAEHNIAVTNYENVTHIDHVTVLGAAHPYPDQAGVEAARQLVDIVKNAQHNELVLVLISGGGSALLPLPIEGISLEDKAEMTALLLASGANINEINCVRKHLSQLKGGRLAALAAQADLHALILSDVLDDDISAIASGPTTPDQTSYQQASNILKNRAIWDKAPQSIRELFNKGCNALIAETPDSTNSIFKHTSHTLIASNSISLNAIATAASQHSHHSQIYNTRLCGEARDEAEQLALYLKSLLSRGLIQALTLVAGGETTVTLTGNGQGGRNQEMALAFAIAAEKHQLEKCWVFLSAGTDGRDGPTDAAGAIVDPDSLKRMRSSKLNPVEFLHNNNSYVALQQSGDLLITGATGTNVADLQILLIDP